MTTAQEKRPSHLGDADKPTEEKELDKALEDTFPASDPPAVTQGITGIPDSVRKRHEEENKDPSSKPKPAA